MAAAPQQPAPPTAEASKDGVVKATTKEEQAHSAVARRDHDLKYMLAEEAKEDSAAITVDEEAEKKEGTKPVSVQQSASFKEEMNVAADLIDPHNKKGLRQHTEMEQASSTRNGKLTTTLHRLLPPSLDLQQGICIIDSGNADAWRVNPAVSANRRVHCMIVSFVTATAGFTVLIVSTNYLDLREAHPTTISLLLFLLTALVTLLVFWQMRVINHLFQLDRIPHRAEESFRLAWRSLVLVQCAVFSYIILSVPFSPLSSPTSASFTSIATAASSVAAAAAAAAAVAAALPLLFPLLLILLLWFVVRGPERLHEEQGPSLIKTNRPRFTWRSLFQALSVILSCSMLLTNPTGTDIAAIAIVVVLTITSFWFALSSNPPAASSPAEKQEAAPEDLLIDKV